MLCNVHACFEVFQVRAGHTSKFMFELPWKTRMYCDGVYEDFALLLTDDMQDTSLPWCERRQKRSSFKSALAPQRDYVSRLSSQLSFCRL